MPSTIEEGTISTIQAVALANTSNALTTAILHCISLSIKPFIFNA